MNLDAQKALDDALTESMWLRRDIENGLVTVADMDLPGVAFREGGWRRVDQQMRSVAARLADVCAARWVTEGNPGPPFRLPQRPAAATLDDFLMLFSSGGVEHHRLCGICALYLIDRGADWCAECRYPGKRERSDIADTERLLFFECGRLDGHKLANVLDGGSTVIWTPFSLRGERALRFEPRDGAFQIRTTLGDGNCRAIVNRRGLLRIERCGRDGTWEEIGTGVWRGELLSLTMTGRGAPLEMLIRDITIHEQRVMQDMNAHLERARCGASLIGPPSTWLDDTEPPTRTTP